MQLQVPAVQTANLFSIGSGLTHQVPNLAQTSPLFVGHDNTTHLSEAHQGVLTAGKIIWGNNKPEFDRARLNFLGSDLASSQWAHQIFQWRGNVTALDSFNDGNTNFTILNVPDGVASLLLEPTLAETAPHTIKVKSNAKSFEIDETIKTTKGSVNLTGKYLVDDEERENNTYPTGTVRVEMKPEATVSFLGQKKIELEDVGFISQLLTALVYTLEDASAEAILPDVVNKVDVRTIQDVEYYATFKRSRDDSSLSLEKSSRRPGQGLTKESQQEITQITIQEILQEYISQGLFSDMTGLASISIFLKSAGTIDIDMTAGIITIKQQTYGSKALSANTYRERKGMSMVRDQYTDGIQRIADFVLGHN